MGAVVSERVFNHDLLVTQEDQQRAAVLFPSLTWLLAFPRLLDWFVRSDLVANRAKRRSRRWGFVAVAMVLVALLIASAESVLVYSEVEAPVVSGHAEEAGDGHSTDIGRILSIVAAVLGAAGGIIGSLGVLYGRPKHRWLANRLVTERLRQLHFQFLIRRAWAIGQASGDEDRQAALLADRDRALARLEPQYRDWTEGTLRTVAEDEEGDLLWLVESAESGSEEKSGVDLTEIFGAYRALRFEEQFNYASHKLRDDPALLSSAPRRQSQVINQASILCVSGVLLIHLVVATSGAIGVDTHSWSPFANVFSIWLALITLSLQVLKEGLRPGEEVERYRHYQWAIRRLRTRFDDAASATQKLKVMEEIEVLSYHEMRRFLIAHREAGFSM